MSDACLAALAKNADSLHDNQTLVKFLEPGYGVDQHRIEILACLRTYPAEKPPDNLESTSNYTLVPWSDRKETLKAARASKKVKYMDDPVIAGAARITALRDQWLIQRGKPNAATKARMKKAADVEKKEQEKQAKAKEKGQQQQDIRRLALTNRQFEAQVGAFRGVLSDSASSDPPELPPTIQTPAFQNAKATGRAARQDLQAKKKASKDRLADRLNAARATRSARTPSPPPIQMELIRPGKRKVRIPMNAVESTPPERMRQVMNND